MQRRTLEREKEFTKTEKANEEKALHPRPSSTAVFPYTCEDVADALLHYKDAAGPVALTAPVSTRWRRYHVVESNLTPHDLLLGSVSHLYV